MEPTNHAATVHPYVLRLGVDYDPVGHPIGGWAVARELNKPELVLHFFTPGPFDDTSDVMTELLLWRDAYIGRLPTLFD